jgi:hypothetical protein
MSTRTSTARFWTFRNGLYLTEPQNHGRVDSNFRLPAPKTDLARLLNLLLSQEQLHGLEISRCQSISGPSYRLGMGS